MVSHHRKFRPFSAQQLAARTLAIPVVSFPDLPVSARRDDIAEAITHNQVVIVAGETGSGKTTQLPKICLQLGRGVAGMIGHTQPRRIAARSVADRIAHELGQKVGREPGQVVGYQVRFTDEVGPTTLIKLMTDGILLAEIQSDPLLRKYDTLIIDEAHERSLNIDFLLGYLANLLPQRPDLKVIITSATIDSERFARHFGVWDGQRGTGTLIEAAPVVEVSGRTFPVEIRYRPLSADLPPSSTVSQPSSASSPQDEATALSPSTSTSRFQQLVLEDPDDDLPTLGYGRGEDIDVETAICHAVEELCAEGDGDILVFLPGERDIRDVEQTLRDHFRDRIIGSSGRATKADSIEVIPLFARLSAAEQQRIFQSHQYRRVVLATNVAETSLTVPGIRYVIDPGFARISRYSNRTKVQRLPIEAVSQASANQRSGRCGRVADGVAIRLYSQRDYENRPEFTEPEILRTSLASVILQMASLGLGEVARFPFVDAPDSRAIRDGLQLLTEIGAITSETTSPQLTPIGKQLAQLPIDPRLGRMLLEARDNGCSSEVAVIVAALSIQDVRERPLEHQEAADTAHARFIDPHSDFVTYLNLWRYLGVQSRDLSGSAFRRLCRSEFLHYVRYREWRDVVTQLRQLAQPLNIPMEPIGLPSSRDVVEEAQLGGIADAAARAAVAYGFSTRSVDPSQVHRSLLVGLLSNIGSWDPAKRDFEGTRATRFTIWPGSGLAKAHPAWVMTAELVETSRLFARTVAKIDVDWVEPLARHLVKCSYSEPYWSTSRGAAMVKEKVTLYGLTLAADRPVLLGRLRDTMIGDVPATQLAREMLIMHGLVEGRWRERHRFQATNDKLVEQAREVERRSRQHGLVAAEDTLAAFFDDLIPSSVVSAGHFAKWWKQARRDNPNLLTYPQSVLLPRGVSQQGDGFPDHWESDGMSLPLSYRFEPGSPRDGVTMTIPVEVLPRLSDAGTAWLVPGMHEELFTEAIRALPKNKRRLLAPAPDVARAALSWLLSHEAGAAFSDDGKQASHADAFSPQGVRDAKTTSHTHHQSSGKVGSATVGSGSWEGDGDPNDPLSLAAAMSRLASWGVATGKARSHSKGTAVPQEPTSSSVRNSSSANCTGITDQAASASSRESSVNAAECSDASSNEDIAGSDLTAHDFDQSFARALRIQRGVDLTADDLAYLHDHLPDHLRMTFSVVDAQGREIAAGKDLPALQHQLAQKADAAIQSAVQTAVAEALDRARRSKKKGKEKRSSQDAASAEALLTTASSDRDASAPSGKDASSDRGAWPFDSSVAPPEHHALTADGLTEFPQQPIPRVISTENTEMTLKGYPALVPQGDPLHPTAGIRILASPADAERHHRLGLAHLLLRAISLATKRITTRWTGREALMLTATSYGSTETLVAHAQLASARTLVDELTAEAGPHSVRNAEDFAQLVTTARQLHEDRVYSILGSVVRAMEAQAELQEALKKYSADTVKYVARDVKRVTRALVGEDFLLRTDIDHLPHLARYLRAGAMRLQRAAGSAQALRTDTEHAEIITELDAAIAQEQAVAARRPFDPKRAHDLESAYWMLHELRVSLFAQQLGTPQKVSAKRILNIINASSSTSWN